MIYKNNTEVHDPRLGCISEYDERSKNFPCSLTPTTPRSYTWSCKIHLDQGNLGSCVGNGWAHERIARPVEVLDITEDDAVEYYHEAQDCDEWPGRAYEGTSVLAGAKVMLRRGYISGYEWAFNLNQALVGISYRGPAVLGINFHECMMYPDKNGIIKPTGKLYGGHCLLATGYNTRTRLVRLHNSWGTGWGAGGDCFILDTDLGKLLDAGGVCCFPIGRKK